MKRRTKKPSKANLTEHEDTFIVGDTAYRVNTTRDLGGTYAGAPTGGVDMARPRVVLLTNGTESHILPLPKTKGERRRQKRLLKKLLGGK